MLRSCEKCLKNVICYLSLQHFTIHVISLHLQTNKNIQYVTGMHAILIYLTSYYKPGLSMTILRVGDKSPMQRGFFTNGVGDIACRRVSGQAI